MQYIKVLYDFCRLSTDDEYSLHHDFSDDATAQDIKFVENIIDFMEQRINPFKRDNSNVIKKIATGRISNQGVADFLVSCTEYGRKAYENLVDERFSKNQKSFWKLFQKVK